MVSIFSHGTDKRATEFRSLHFVPGHQNECRIQGVPFWISLTSYSLRYALEVFETIAVEFSSLYLLIDDVVTDSFEQRSPVLALVTVLLEPQWY